MRKQYRGKLLALRIVATLALLMFFMMTQFKPYFGMGLVMITLIVFFVMEHRFRKEQTEGK